MLHGLAMLVIAFINIHSSVLVGLTRGCCTAADRAPT